MVCWVFLRPSGASSADSSFPRYTHPPGHGCFPWSLTATTGMCSTLRPVSVPPAAVSPEVVQSGRAKVMVWGAPQSHDDSAAPLVSMPRSLRSFACFACWCPPSDLDHFGPPRTGSAAARRSIRAHIKASCWYIIEVGREPLRRPIELVQVDLWFDSEKLQ